MGKSGQAWGPALREQPCPPSLRSGDHCSRPSPLCTLRPSCLHAEGSRGAGHWPHLGSPRPTHTRPLPQLHLRIPGQLSHEPSPTLTGGRTWASAPPCAQCCVFAVLLVPLPRSHRDWTSSYAEAAGTAFGAQQMWDCGGGSWLGSLHPVPVLCWCAQVESPCSLPFEPSLLTVREIVSPSPGPESPG